MTGVLCVAVCLLFPAAALAAPGDLDTGFGAGGIVSSSAGTISDVALQSDGKIVVVGSTTSHCGEEPDGEYVCHSEFLVERYDDDGSLDPSFGSGGVVTTNFGVDSQGAASVAIEPDGKIVVAGTAEVEVAPGVIKGGFALARYEADGTLDDSFGGGDGKVTATVPGTRGPGSEPGTMALLANGKIIVGGSAEEENIPEWEAWHMVLARFDGNGTLDTTYGDNGIVIGPEGNTYGLTADSSGRALVAGWSSYDFAVARFTADGALDTGFANGGLIKMDLNPTGSKAADVLVEPDGKILASGYGAIGMTVIRLNEDGSPDASFGGGDGIVTPSFGHPCCIASSAIRMALQPDGRILIAGQWHPLPFEVSADDEWALARLYGDGAPDTGFGANGLVTNAFNGGGYGDYADGLALQPDGKIVVIGNSGSAVYPEEDFGIMRFLGGGTAPQLAGHRLMIRNADPEGGRVYGPELLSCGYNCGAEYEAGETVELSAEGEWQYSGGSMAESTQVPFTGWTTISGNPGTCTGTTTPCQVVLSENVELAAHFGSGGGGGTGGESPPEETGDPGGSEIPAGGGGEETPPASSGSSPTSSTSAAQGPTTGPLPASPARSTAKTKPTPKSKPLKCRKGFKKSKVHDKAKCVKATKAPPRMRHRH